MEQKLKNLTYIVLIGLQVYILRPLILVIMKELLIMAQLKLMM